MKAIAYHTIYVKTPHGYEISEEFQREFKLPEGEDLPCGDWVSETHEVSYDYAD